ncbi:MAG: hypothetical protein ACLVJH_04665 [Faecalibacterium prausnitzii]
MRRDFPAGELKPLSMILNSEAAGTRPHLGRVRGRRAGGVSVDGAARGL